MWAAQTGAPRLEQCRQPISARCFFGRGLHVRPKWAAHKLAHMGLLWAQCGLPRLGCPGWNNVGSPYRLDVFLAAGSTLGPSGQPMNYPTWAYCGPNVGCPVWAAQVGTM